MCGLPDGHWGDNAHTTSNSKALVLCNHATDAIQRGDYVNARKYYDAAVEGDPGAYLMCIYARGIFEKRSSGNWPCAI
jgi:hypothetical protein